MSDYKKAYPGNLVRLKKDRSLVGGVCGWDGYRYSMYIPLRQTIKDEKHLGIHIVHDYYEYHPPLLYLFQEEHNRNKFCYLLWGNKIFHCMLTPFRESLEVEDIFEVANENE